MNRIVRATVLAGIGYSASWAAANPLFHFTDLGVLPNTIASGATQLNDAGQVVGYVADLQSTRSFLYTAGAMIDTTPITGANTGVVAVNNSGKLLFTGAQPGIYDPITHSVESILVPAGSTGISATAFNGAGVVAVNAVFNDKSRAYIFDSGSYVEVSPVTSSFASAITAINASGQVTGVAYNPDPYPFLYSPGVGAVFLPRLTTTIQGQGNDVNDLGDVVGDGHDFFASGNSQAFYYHAASNSVVELKPLPGVSSNAYARGVNNAGWTVGYSGNVNLGTLATLWTTDAKPLNLTGMLDNTVTGLTLVDAQDINSVGQIVGTAVYDPDGPFGPISPISHAYLLTPVPEPTAIFVIPAAALGLLIRRPCRGKLET